ncbi:hypothetical protein KOW79_009618 [Hemibagrus wyckioides]|uniref:Uncharacterized protein n=1 Tax=Hemibagrus wyckioides TaxID=337641 RepID=A0A9D3NQ14_9TELE|nr:hypothetical protein KOW79_009618 [Hemibagrus wyckioides]
MGTDTRMKAGTEKTSRADASRAPSSVPHGSLQLSPVISSITGSVHSVSSPGSTAPQLLLIGQLLPLDEVIFG